MKALAVMLCMLCSWSVPARAGDVQRGEIVAKVRCMPCHHLTNASKNVGPSLQGIYGRAPSITGVPFVRWDDAALEQWLQNPRAVKPNTKMSIPPVSARDRADIIAYFKSVAESK